MALAALIIKEELGASDRACVEQITEKPYLQYFCGLKAFITEPAFDASLLVHFRKLFPADVLTQVNNAIAKKVSERQLPPEDAPPPKKDKEPSSNQGKLLVDATCTPADITYPTDLKLLNKAREGAQIFCRIRSYISTCRKHGLKSSYAFELLFDGRQPDFIL